MANTPQYPPPIAKRIFTVPNTGLHPVDDRSTGTNRRQASSTRALVRSRTELPTNRSTTVPQKDYYCAQRYTPKRPCCW